MAVAPVPSVIAEFLDVATPKAWLDEAIDRLPELLHDHANCELKAAGTALGFIYRYPERAELAYRMSRLAREELRHFEQVRKMLADRNIDFAHVSASRYAGDLRRACREKEPQRLLDILLVGALIEARSCERFAALVPRLPDDIAGFYAGLLASETRHFEHYLAFARAEVALDDGAFEQRLAELKALEATLITSPDSQFRFHSGIPQSA